MAVPTCPIKPSDFAACIVTAQDPLGTKLFKLYHFVILLYLTLRFEYTDYRTPTCAYKKMLCSALQECGKADTYDCLDDVVVPPTGDTNCRKPIIGPATFVRGTFNQIWVECTWTLPTSKIISASLVRYNHETEQTKEIDITKEPQPYLDRDIVEGRHYQYTAKVYCAFDPATGTYTTALSDGYRLVHAQ